MNSIRQKTIEAAKVWGVQISASLPSLEQSSAVHRSAADLAGRMLSITCVVSLSFDMARQPRISQWATREKVIQHMTDKEREFLAGDTTNRAAMQWRVEALFTLAWATTLSEQYQPLDLCPDNLSSLFPSISKGESSGAINQRLRLRALPDLIAALDLYYCLHWHIRDSMLKGKAVKLPLEAAAIIERRHAMEWLLGEEDWERVTLDT